MIAEPEPVILKINGRGRVRTPVDQREGLLDAFERCGLSDIKLAALHGVKYPSFANWMQQRKRRRLAAVAGSGDGVSLKPEVRLAGASSGSGNPFQWWEAVVGGEAAVGNDPVPAGFPDFPSKSGFGNLEIIATFSWPCPPLHATCYT